MDTVDPAGDSVPVWLPTGNASARQTRTPVRRFDDGMVSPNGRDQTLAVRQQTAERAEVNRLAAWGLASVLVLSGYECLISGLDKVFSAEYRSGLAGELNDAMDGNPNHWY